MDVATIDNEFQQLQVQSQQAVQAIQGLAQKLQTADQSGDANAREWLLDLKSITLQIQQEQLQTQALLQALHDFTVNNLQQAPPPPPAYAQQAAPMGYAQPAAPVYAQPGYVQGPPQGGMLSHFMGSGFGQAMTKGMGMGAGFGLADSLISDIFHR